MLTAVFTSVNSGAQLITASAFFACLTVYTCNVSCPFDLHCPVLELSWTEGRIWLYGPFKNVCSLLVDFYDPWHLENLLSMTTGVINSSSVHSNNTGSCMLGFHLQLSGAAAANNVSAIIMSERHMAYQHGLRQGSPAPLLGGDLHCRRSCVLSLLTHLIQLMEGSVISRVE